MKKVSELFDVRYGHSLQLNRLTIVDAKDGIPFVSRQRKNNGVAAYVAEVPGVEPYDGGELTCALNGQGGVMSTFLQESPFYTAFHVACLRPKVEMTRGQRLYYCECLWANHYRYSWGRQANKTVKDILVPSLEELPEWASEGFVTQRFSEPLERVARLSGAFANSDRGEGVGLARVAVQELFTVTYGHSLELNHLEQSPYGVNFVSRTSRNNGISARVAGPSGLTPAKAGLLTVACGGSVMETFLQLEPFYSGRDIYWLEAKDELTVEERLFYCACIRANKFRYNYGRQANKSLGSLDVPSPDSIPSWVNGSIRHVVDCWSAQLGIRASSMV